MHTPRHIWTSRSNLSQTCWNVLKYCTMIYHYVSICLKSQATGTDQPSHNARSQPPLVSWIAPGSKEFDETTKLHVKQTLSLTKQRISSISAPVNPAWKALANRCLALPSNRIASKHKTDKTGHESKEHSSPNNSKQLRRVVTSKLKSSKMPQWQSKSRLDCCCNGVTLFGIRTKHHKICLESRGIHGIIS